MVLLLGPVNHKVPCTLSCFKYRPYGKGYLPITYCFRINFPKVTPDTDTNRKLFWN